MAGSMKRKTRLAMIVDPRFSGGTSSAVAREIRVLAPHFDLQVHAIETRMFKGRSVHSAIEKALGEEGLDLIWNAPLIRAEIVVLHNPSCLKFDAALNCRIYCGTFFTVSHENFLSPQGQEGYDVGHCLELLEDGVLAARRYIAPVSGYNRRTVQTWLASNDRSWRVAAFNWFNICDFDMLPPSPPRDRRGRHSRAGFEKFPPLSDMEIIFPPTADACRILGADSYLLDPESIPENWDAIPFGAEPVGDFLKTIDFFVYYTAPTLQESFGRVIAEAIAAGKLVITDQRTAEAFGPAVYVAEPKEVSDVVSRFIRSPKSYVRFVRNAQTHLEKFSSTMFLNAITQAFADTKNGPHDFL